MIGSPSSDADREHDPALGAAVELGEHDPGHPDRLGELACLDEAVLAGRRVEDEQHLGDVPRRPIGDAADLSQLLHQVRLRVQPAGGVGEHEVRAAALRRGDRVEDDR